MTPDGKPDGVAASSTGLDPNVAAALAYAAGWVTGLLFLVIERRSGYVRFHAAQSVVGLGALWLLGVLIYGLALGSLVGSFAAFVFLTWVARAVWAGWVVLWMICLFKAYTGERWKMPLAGDAAERLIRSPWARSE
jgi:uncharacterized membrane protein